MGYRSKTKCQKKARASAIHTAKEEFSSVPHSFVFHRGQIGKMVQELVLNVRRVMEPFTATSLKVQKKNTLKDFVSVVGPLGITHFLVFSKTSENINFRLARVPRGPTLMFRVTEYSLIKDVISSLKHHRMHEQQFTHPPLIILNNFGLPGMHIKLMATMFQNLFPSINVHKVNLNTIKRCILIHYDPSTQLISFRHYSLKVVPVGMSKGVKKLLQEKFPNMSRWEDISDLLAPGTNLSESEAELDGEHNITELPQSYAGRGNMKAQQSAVRLTEIGPRMTLQLIKIEEGLNDGKVLYHSFVHKTEEELKAALERKEEKLRLKAERRKKQEHDIAQKKALREDHKKKSLEGIRKKQQGPEEDSEAEDLGMAHDNQAAAESEEDDAEYYRQEVGQEPDGDLFPQSGKRKRKGPYRSPQSSKKFKVGKPGKPGQREKSPGRRGDAQQPRFKKQRLLRSKFPGSGLRVKLGALRGPRGSTAKRGKRGPRSRAIMKGRGEPRGQAHQKQLSNTKRKQIPKHLGRSRCF
uniref:Suppressor of SWI4 1 homolog n=1 Tax=Geotrypetes seraphini TaxID=260995 RepID=A0A6P8PE90_GEOSA|nr:suppressor of SWI4 1 homolog [Geotrypetes seraphini]